MSAPWLDPRSAPGDLALAFEGTRLSRAELAARADALANELMATGVEAGSVVAALLPNTPDFVVTVHALDRLGAIFLPLNTRLTATELSQPLRDSGARWLLHDGGALAPLARQAAGGVRLVELSAPAPLPSCQPFTNSPGLAALLYTSGTTGRAKGAWLPATSLRASAKASARHLGVRKGDLWLACLPLFHVGGLSILLRSAYDATTVLLHPRFDAEAVSRALDADGVTGISLVPTMLLRLLEVRSDRPAPESLRCVLLGGGPAPATLLERAAKLGFPLATTYGLTEAASQVATLRPGPDADASRDGLEPLPGTEVRITRDDGSVAAPDEPGEIQVRGPTVMRGYWKRPDETRRALDGGWLHTGDVGAVDRGGRLRVFDRRRDLIISGGENVYPAEIEAVLCEHPAVAEAGVAGSADAEFGRRPIAWVLPRPGQPVEPVALESFCRGRLAGYKVPIRFHAVDELPRSASGKLQRHRLEEP